MIILQHILLTQFNSLAYIGVASALTSISIFIAAMVFVSNVVITRAVEKTHKEELENTKSNIEKMTAIYQHFTSAKIYTMYATHSINLYVDIPTPTTGYQNELYRSYLNIAINMAKAGYRPRICRNVFWGKKPQPACIA